MSHFGYQPFISDMCMCTNGELEIIKLNWFYSIYCLSDKMLGNLLLNELIDQYEFKYQFIYNFRNKQKLNRNKCSLPSSIYKKWNDQWIETTTKTRKKSPYELIQFEWLPHQIVVYNIQRCSPATHLIRICWLWAVQIAQSTSPLSKIVIDLMEWLAYVGVEYQPVAGVFLWYKWKPAWCGKYCDWSSVP